MIHTLSTFFASVIHRLFEPAKFKLETDKLQYLLGETIVTDVFINPNQNLVVNNLSLSIVCFENSTEVFTRSEVPKAGPGILTKNQQDIPLDPINTQVIKETSKKLLEKKEQSHKHLQINRNQNFLITSKLKIPLVLPPHSVGSQLKWEIHLTIDLEHHKQSRSLKYPLEISSQSSNA